MDDGCCIFMLFFLFRMLSEDWYTWMLTAAHTSQVRLENVCVCVCILVHVHIQQHKIILIAKWGHFSWSSQLHKHQTWL